MSSKPDIFYPEIYRANSLDLAHLDSASLRDHFERAGFAEPRIFGPTSTTSQYLSMKWLRGNGIEIGAGRYPMELFGNAQAINADIDSGALFGTEAIEHRLSIDAPVPATLAGRFDFVIASHVLEHADGLIQAIQNLIDLARPDGTIYIVVPDIRFLVDAEWMPFFDFAHHVEEYREPGRYNSMHDRLAHDHMRRNSATASGGAQLVSGGQVHAGDMLRLLNEGEGGESRFMNHQHTYDPDGWLGLFVDIQRFLPRRFTILETRYGMERSDCHFVLRKLAR
jgi:SAM-dependent methyltransferase